MANVEQWLVRAVDHRRSAFNLAARAGFAHVVAGQMHLSLHRPRDLRSCDVLGQIDKHRAGATGLGNVKSFVDTSWNVMRVLDQHVPLRAGTGDAGDVRFLERVSANGAGGDLT